MFTRKQKIAFITETSHEIDIVGRSLWQDARYRFTKNKAAMVSLVILLIISCLVLIGPELSQHTFDDTDFSATYNAPSIDNGYYFGTDSLGRDLFSRTLIGGRVSLMVGILGALVAVLIGTIYGATSGFIGRGTDRVMMRLLEILNSIPFMFFIIVMVTLFGRHLWLIFVAVGAISWLDMARIVRGQTLSLRNREFIEAAYTSGVKRKNIILRHIVPNVLGIVVVYATLLVPNMILIESFLSFLGLGVQAPMTSWGSLLQEGASAMEVAIWQLLFPAFFMVITLFCFNYLGDGLRDALDPKDR